MLCVDKKNTFRKNGKVSFLLKMILPVSRNELLQIRLLIINLWTFTHVLDIIFWRVDLFGPSAALFILDYF
ncbi:hypothetical protein C8U37_11411 [Trichococcus patagoniensis]|uniref:Uncharacterized protein n=1 Tax=Trichococcus patagoniensis TaxID=382641 RepID=A0A2T5IHF8_9LACT|nr:hypothetical protein C8U37_11411 [Trichococcus patagoniensis]